MGEKEKLLDEIKQLKEKVNELEKLHEELLQSEEELQASNQQLKFNENLLKEQEILLNEVGKIAKIGGWEMDMTRNGEASWTKGVYDILEVDYGNTVPGFDEHVSWYLPEYREIVKDTMNKLVQDHQPMQYVAPFKTAKGNIRWGKAIGEAVLENGKLLKIRGTFQDITESKKAENELKESEKRLKSIIENTTNLFYAHSINYELTFLSPQIYEYLGYTPDEAMIRWTNFITDNPINKEGVEFTEKAIKTGKRQPTYELELQRKDGKKIMVEVREAPLIENGKVVSIVGSLSDITERKNAENALVDSENKFRSFVESANDIIYQGTPDGVFTYVSPSWTETLGYEFDEVVGQNFAMFVHPDDIPFCADFLRKVLITGQKQKGVEYRVKHKDGSWRWHVSNGSPLKDPDGKVSSFLGIARDITARKKQEKITYELNQRYQTIVKNFPNGFISLLDKSFKFKYVEGKALGKAKMNPEEIIGKKIDEIFPPDISDILLQNVSSLFEGKQCYYEVEFLGNIYANWGEPIFNKENEIEEGLIYSLDITELKLAKEKAEEANRLKTAFLANMSHEIRTPMNGILGFTDLLKEATASPEDQQKYINIIQNSGERLINTINDIIDISKIESGQISVKYSEVNINHQINDLQTFFSPQVQDKGVVLMSTKSLPDKDAFIITDNDKLYAVFTNLIKNAIKFTDQGKITVGYFKKGGSMQFFVKDTGMGIPEERKESIFERFVQADTDHTRPYEGSGLGLSITKAYVEMLGGEIWFESEEGSGSTFYFALPNETTPGHPKTTIGKMSGKVQDDSVKKETKLLIVDDEEAVREYLNRILKDDFKTILFAKNGREALAVFKENRGINVILMDIKMPEMDGYTATREIRKINKEVVIIAQTAFAMQGDREKVLEAGCNDYIAKPIQKEKLKLLIESYI